VKAARGTYWYLSGRYIEPPYVVEPHFVKPEAAEKVDEAIAAFDRFMRSRRA